jgi:hypothetical protein
LRSALPRVKDRKGKSQEKENRGEPAGDLGEDVGRLGAENILRHATAEGRAETLTFRSLHQDHEHHDQRDEEVNPEKDIGQNAHWDGQYP